MSTSSPIQTAPQEIFLADYLPPAFLVKQVNLTFKLHATKTLVTACLHLQHNPERTETNLPLVLDANNLQPLSLAINDQPLSASEYQLTSSNLTIAELAGQPLPNEFKLHSQVELNPSENTALEGLYLSSGNLSTQCEAEGFRRITFYPDRPDVLATFKVRLEANKADFPILLANGNCVAKGNLPSDSKETAGWHFAEWEDPFPKPSYLFALVAGKLHLIPSSFTTQSGREVKLELWVEKENLHKGDFALEALKKAMRWDEENYGREYDLDIFMLVAVNDFNMGAMENKGLNIFNSSCVLANPKSETDATFAQIESIVAHEYLHNWSGNRVTCRDWFQLALKEGFTVFRDQQFSASLNSAGVERINQVKLLRSAQFAEDAGPTAHPVRPASYVEINNFYTLTIYEKGAELVRMLHQLLGAEKFRQASDLYFAKFDGQAATLEDFIGCMQKASGLDLSQFMLWYSQAGTPELTCTAKFDAAAGSYTLTVKQHTPPTPEQAEKQPLMLPLKLALFSSQGEAQPLILNGKNLGTETTLVITQAEESFTFLGLTSQPIASLLRGFSAPVKLNFASTPAELSLLLAKDNDSFNAWNAGQQLAVLAIQEAMQDLMQQESPDTKNKSLYLPLEKAWQQLLTTALAANKNSTNENPSSKNQQETDLSLLAEKLTLPSLTALMEELPSFNLDILIAARQQLVTQLAARFNSKFSQLYSELNQPEEFSLEPAARAKRQLKNTCLYWLAANSNSANKQLVTQAFNQASNMTDQLAALTYLVHFYPAFANEKTSSQEALASFYNQWQNDQQVLDSWFRVQASQPSLSALGENLEQLEQLEKHPAFNLKNPNKVRALLGAFAVNLPVFHSPSGVGYAYLAQKVIQLDALNPQIAARLVLPLTRLAKLDAARQELLLKQLNFIAQQLQLSKDLSEVVNKALATYK